MYYNLQEYDESMLFALGAGKLFSLDRVGEFEETIICTTSSSSHPVGSKSYSLLIRQYSKMCRHVHCTVRHAQPYNTSRHCNSTTTTAHYCISINHQRCIQHVREPSISNHSFLSVYLTFKVSLISASRIIYFRSVFTGRR